MKHHFFHVLNVLPQAGEVRLEVLSLCHRQGKGSPHLQKDGGNLTGTGCKVLRSSAALGFDNSPAINRIRFPNVFQKLPHIRMGQFPLRSAEPLGQTPVCRQGHWRGSCGLQLNRNVPTFSEQLLCTSGAIQSQRSSAPAPQTYLACAFPSHPGR